MSSATSDMSFEITVVGQVPDYVLYELNGFRGRKFTRKNGINKFCVLCTLSAKLLVHCSIAYLSVV